MSSKPERETKRSDEQAGPDLEFQLDWDVGNLRWRWPNGPDNEYIMARLKDLPVEATAEGGPRTVLEVAAAEAILSCKLNLRGLRTFVLEPSPVMIGLARQRGVEYGAALEITRGVAETLPFHDQSFDRVLCDSAIDHVADPRRSISEMTRVLKADGRLVIGAVNYGSLSVRLSRLFYRVWRATGRASHDEHLFWDTPVPVEHTFECTYSILLQLCEPYLELERVSGLSIGWMTPGWGSLLGKISRERAMRILSRLDRMADRSPRYADYVLTVWRRKPGAALLGRPNSQQSVVDADDVVYPWKTKAEAEYWADRDFGTGYYELLSAGTRDANAAYTGDPSRSWFDDLIGRGPFRDAAMLGCDETAYEAAWLEAGASTTLDVYELSSRVIRKVRVGLGMGRWSRESRGRRVRFIEADLNFVTLPPESYDVIWSSGCLHHVANLEHLFEQVERALRPEGLFAVHDYVGERRLQYADYRLERINEVLRRVPLQYRRGRTEAVTRPRIEELSPFCGVRSDEILARAQARFEVVHLARAGALFPLTIILDMPAIEREAPEVKEMVEHAEGEARNDPRMTPCGAYAVFRKRRPNPAGGRDEMLA